MRHGDDVYLVALEEDMVLMLRGSDLSERGVGLRACQLISAHQIGNHNIFFEMRERPDYRSSHLQMICWHFGHSGTREWLLSELTCESVRFCNF